MPRVTETRLTKRTVEATRPGAYAWDGEVRGFGVRVTPAGTRSFVYRYKVDGRQRYEPLGGFPAMTVEQARELAKAKAGRGRDTDHRAEREQAAEERRRAKSLHYLADHYLGDYAKARALRPSTIRDARGVLRLVPPVVLARRVDELGKADVRRLYGEAREAAGKSQANRLLAVLSKMFALAEEEGWRSESNPCRGVERAKEDERWRNLNEAEVARLLTACDGYLGQDPAKGQNAADAVRLLLFTGARLQEVLRAEWAQFDLEAGRWVKPSSHTKTKRQHFLDLDGPALDLLRDMRQRAPSGRFLFPGEHAQVAPGRLEERPRADLKRPWAWIAGEAGLDGVRLHDLRRTTASFMLSGGASLATVGKTLGHTQAATTARYAHLSQTVQREELKRAGERMASLKGTAPSGKVVPLRSAEG